MRLSALQEKAIVVGDLIYLMSGNTEIISSNYGNQSQNTTITEAERNFILKNILSEIKKVITAQQFDMWFSSIKLSSITENSITFLAPNDFIKEWLYTNYLDLFFSTVYKVLNSLREVVFSTEIEILDHSTYLPTIAAPIEGDIVNAQHNNNYASSLNRHYCFETFVVGQCNRLAHASAVAVAESPGQAYNPLFIHGASGLGKTHLLHAINNVLQTKHGMNTFYLSCERFISHYISTIRSNSWGVFRSLYSSIDALLIDDIQLFENSQGSREEFFHIFNTLYNAKKQIIITSDCPPESIKFLEDRLVSRFKWGLLCSINTPTIETRIAIIEKKALLFGLNLPYEFSSYLAENIQGSIREIEGAIARLNKELRLTKTNATLLTIKKIVQELSSGRKLVNIEAILEAVSKRYNVRVSQILSKHRLRSITLPRHIAMHLSRKLTGMSLSEIGGYIGGRDHSTVIHADEKIATLAKRDKNLLLILQKLESNLTS